MKDYTKKDFENIVKDEIKRFISSELDEEISKILKKSNSKSREVTKDVVKHGLSKLAEFLWVRKNVWQNDIR